MNEKSSKDVNRRDLNHLKYLISHAWKWDKLLFVYYGLFTLLTAVQPFISLFSIKWLIDELTTEMNVIVLACILGFFLLGGAMVNALVTFIKNLYMPRLILLRFKFINQMQRKAMKMDFRYTEDPKTLDDLENAGQAVSSNHVGIEGVFHKLFEVSGSLVSLLTYMSLLFMLSPWVLLYLFLNMLFVYYLTSRAKKYEFSKKDENAALNRRSSYLYNTMSDFKFGKEIRIYQLGNWLCEKFRGIKGEHLQLTKKIQKRYLGVSLVDAILILIREGIVYAYLIYCVLAKGLSLGSFSMYFTSISHFTTTLQSVMEDLAHLRLQLLYVNHFRTFLEIQDELPLEEPTPIPLLKPYTIEFKKVSFKYPNSERYIFKDLSFKIKAGERLAIVGINGAGKTTLVKLITRLYEPTDGEILLDGINVKNLDRAKYFDLFSVVFQDIKVLAFTVGENVAIQNRDVLDRARVMECLEQAGIKDKIASLKHGIETPMLKGLEEEGIELSGGQNQKLALARALYKNGDIVILDEPTSALDPLAEYEIYQNFDALIGDKTAIYISHRLSSTRFCDAIAFFENGEILEYGTHEELLAQKGRYAEMFNIQAQYYQLESVEEMAACAN